MAYSKSITFQRLLNAPIDEAELIPPRSPGVYVVTLDEWSGGVNPPSHGVIYVGQTSKGKDPHLLHRIAGLLMDSIGFSEEPDERGGYFHSGGHSIWRAYKKDQLRDPRTLHLSWNSECCVPCEETWVYKQFKPNTGNGFLGKAAPPECSIPGHPLPRAE